MDKFNWSKEDIVNSDLSDEYKEILIAELEGTIKAFDPSNSKIYSPNHLELGRNFRADMQELQLLDPRMADVSLNECLNFNPDEEIIFNVPMKHITPNALVGEVLHFFKTLNDSEISSEANELMNPENRHLMIEEYDENNPICSEVRGRCIKNYDYKTIFASYYMRKNLDDFTILAHECGHMLSAKMFGDKINPIIKNYLSEVEAYYFELLCAHYIDTITTDPNNYYLGFNMRLVKTIDYMWHIRKQYILSRHLFKPSLRKLNKELSRIPNADKVTEEGYKELYRFSTRYVNVMIHSMLAATDLYYQTLEDTEKGVSTFKKFMLSKDRSIKELFGNANITYLDDECHNFEYLHEESKSLKKLLK